MAPLSTWMDFGGDALPVVLLCLNAFSTPTPIRQAQFPLVRIAVYSGDDQLQMHKMIITGSFHFDPHTMLVTCQEAQHHATIALLYIIIPWYVY